MVFILVIEAIKRYAIPAKELFHLGAMGKIEIVKLETGDLIIETEALEMVLPKEYRADYRKFSDLKGVSLGLRESARKYNIPYQTISRWAKRGYIKILGVSGKKILVDEMDLAYCAQLYRANPGQGKRIFGPGGIPYRPKNK